MSKDKAIDVETLKDLKEESDFVSLPFLFPKHPDDKGTSFAYRVKFKQNVRSFVSKKGNDYNCADAKLLKTFNDEDVEEGKEYTLILHEVLRKKLLKLIDPIGDVEGDLTKRTFEFMGKGMIRPKKGRPYYNFAVRLYEGTLDAPILMRSLENLPEPDESE